jgi:penicillin-binding protein 2
LLRAYAGIATGGLLHTPHLLLEAGAPGPRAPYQADKPLKIRMSEETRELVAGGLWAVVNEGGTGTRASVKGFDVSGKTGTAQVVALNKTRGEFKDHAWFAAFAPLKQPEIAVVVLVENVGFGGTHSAPVAGAVFDAYYKKHHAPPEDVQIAEGESGRESSASTRLGVTTSVLASTARTTATSSPSVPTTRPGAAAARPKPGAATPSSAGTRSTEATKKKTTTGAPALNGTNATRHVNKKPASAPRSTGTNRKPVSHDSSTPTFKHRPRTVNQQARVGERKTKP